jgi:hypothetical protein
MKHGHEHRTERPWRGASGNSGANGASSGRARSIPDHACSFDPVPLERVRHDGWTVERQRQFIAALGVMGSVGKALKAVGMGRVSAYALRQRPAAESFAQAWDDALYSGQMEQYSYAMDRAINGVTTIRVRRGGMIEVEAMPDIALMRAAVKKGPRG